MVSIEARVAVNIDGAEEGDEVTRIAREELLQDLQDAAQVGVKEVADAHTGAKGAATDLILAAGTSGGITALVRIFQLWLSRDRYRSLIIKRLVNGQEHVIEIRGDNLSAANVEQAVDAIWRDKKD